MLDPASPVRLTDFLYCVYGIVVRMMGKAVLVSLAFSVRNYVTLQLPLTAFFIAENRKDVENEHAATNGEDHTR